MDVAEFKSLQKKATRLQRDVDRAEGVQAQLMQTLKAEFDCDTLAEAKAKLQKISRRQRKLEEQYTTAKHQFDKDWFDVLATRSEDGGALGASTARHRQGRRRRNAEA